MFIIHICFGAALFSLMEKKNKQKQTATLFHQNMPVCIKQIMAGKPASVFVYLLQNIVYDQMEEKTEKTASPFYSSALRMFVFVG